MPFLPPLFDLGRRVHAAGRLFVIGDSFSTIRRTGGTNDVNGRFSAASGSNLWDWFRFSFDPILDMDITTNFAREGAYAFRDWSPAPGWSAINPIPSAASQFSQLAAANPANTITRHDVAGVLIGTNDGINPDGGVKPTNAQVTTAIDNVVGQLIGHGFRKIMVLLPEGKHQPALAGTLIPLLSARAAANRSLRIVWAFADSGIRAAMTGPYLPDNTHPSDLGHQLLGEAMAAAWGGQGDRRGNLILDAGGSSLANPRRIGFTNFDAGATGSACQVFIADQHNGLEAVGNRRLTFRSYNGLVILAAGEADNAADVGVGGGKNDSCVAIRGRFWEHPSILELESSGGSNALLTGKRAGVDKIKIANTGAITVDEGTDTADLLTLIQGSATRLQISANGRAPVSGFNRPAFRATYSAPQNVAQNTWTRLIYGTEPFDSDSSYDPATGIFTVPAGMAGLYFFCGAWIGPTSGVMILEVYDASQAVATGLAHCRLDSKANSVVTVGSNTAVLTAGAQCALRIYQPGSNVSATDGSLCFFSGFRISA